MEEQALKRKRHDGHDDGFRSSQPPSKIAKPGSGFSEPNHPQSQQIQYQSPHTPYVHVNYLSRQYPEDVPLLQPTDDTLPQCLNIINQYDGALERSESLANNLGARPIASVLLQRFERMFDGPPVVVSYPSNQSNDTTPIQVLEPQNISWVDVVNASESIAPDRVIDMQDPHDQAKRVVRFEVKGCEVQVGWEEWQMMRSGMAKNMLPSQPAPEDEDKELATLDILEELVGKVVGLADQVAARARQFNHRLRARKVALADRTSKRTVTINHADPINPNLFIPRSSQSNPEVRAELLRLFQANRRMFSRTDTSSLHARHPSSDHHMLGSPSTVHHSSPSATTKAFQPTITITSGSPAHFNPSTPSSTKARKPPSNPQDEGAFKPEMTARVDMMPKGAPIIPPCDRCRRLRIDCLKNLTACAGCTKKHCKCTWREVTHEEVRKGSMIATGGVAQGVEHGGIGEWMTGLEGVKVADMVGLDGQGGQRGVEEEERWLGQGEEGHKVDDVQNGNQQLQGHDYGRDAEVTADEANQFAEHRENGLGRWAVVSASGSHMRDAAIAAAAVEQEAGAGVKEGVPDVSQHG